MVYSMVSEQIKVVRNETDAANREYVLWLLGGSVGPTDKELRQIVNSVKDAQGRPIAEEKKQ